MPSPRGLVYYDPWSLVRFSMTANMECTLLPRECQGKHIHPQEDVVQWASSFRLELNLRTQVLLQNITLTCCLWGTRSRKLWLWWHRVIRGTVTQWAFSHCSRLGLGSENSEPGPSWASSVNRVQLGFCSSSWAELLSELWLSSGSGSAWIRIRAEPEPRSVWKGSLCWGTFQQLGRGRGHMEQT